MRNHHKLALLGTTLALAGMGPLPRAVAAELTAPCAVAGACTELPDTIYDDVMLDPSKTYHVAESVTIAFDSSLTIPAGTRLYFEQYVAIYSYGVLRVQGTAVAPVLMAAATPGKDWSGIAILDQSIGSTIRGAHFESATSAITVDTSSAEIADNDIVGFIGIALYTPLASPPTRVLRNTLTGTGPRSTGIEVINFSPDVVAGGEIRDNTIRSYETGISVMRSSPVIAGNKIESSLFIAIDNFEGGSPQILDNRITTSRRGIMTRGGSPVIRGNMLADNTCFGIYLAEQSTALTRPVVNRNTLLRNQGSCYSYDLNVALSPSNGPIDARENFWGTTNIKEVMQHAGLESRSPQQAVVNVCPFLDAESKQVACN